MAYMNQQKKAVIAAALKAVMPAGWKYSLSVQNKMTILLTFKSAPVDLIAMINAKNAKQAERDGQVAYVNDGYAQLNHFYLESAFGADPEVLAVMEAAKKALFCADYYNNSDIQTDYFDCAYYVSMHVGSYDKPFVVA